MSNEQSSPPRKVKPYKKGGRRQSPFADMAFQFSGTALDVAIQQRQENIDQPPAPLPDEEGADHPSSEPAPAEEPSRHEADHVIPTDEAVAVHDLAERLEVEAGPTLPTETATPAVAIPSDKPARKVRKKRSTAKKRPAPAKKRLRRPSPPVTIEPFHPTPTEVSSFQTFADQWKPVLHSGQLKMCEVLFNRTHAIGFSDCEISVSVLSKECGLSRRHLFRIIFQLENTGFVERLATSNHITREGIGSRFRLNLAPKTKQLQEEASFSGTTSYDGPDGDI